VRRIPKTQLKMEKTPFVVLSGIVVFLCILGQYKSLFFILPLFKRGKSVNNKFLFSMTAWEQWVNYPVQGQNDRFVPCQLGDLNLQPSGY
jgi:hypothetical protein